MGESFNEFMNSSSPLKIGSKSRPASNSPKNKDEESEKKSDKNQAANVKVLSFQESAAQKSVGGLGKIKGIDLSDIVDEKEELKKDDEQIAGEDDD